MKLRIGWMILAIAFIYMPSYASAAVVFETTDWIIGVEGLSYEFEADTAAFDYKVTLSDLSTPPIFGFDQLVLVLTTSTGIEDTITGPGSFNFIPTPGRTYFANIFGEGGGTVGAGLFGLEVLAAPVPVPPAFLLFGSSLFALFAFKRKNRV